MRREPRIGALQEARKVLVGYLEGFELKELLVKTRELVEWKCMLLLVSYCCDIHEG